jgi:hypothetical protein
MFFGTFLIIAITYWPLNALYELVFPPKELKRMDLDMEEGEMGEMTPEQEAAAAAAAKADAIEKGDAAQDLEDAAADKMSGASLKMEEDNE